MGSASQPLSEASQILSRTQSFNTNASGAATITFPNPPAGFTWTGTLNCALASTGAVFLATVGGVSWGEWGGNSVYGPVQVLGNGGQQLVVTVTGLAASTNYTLQWNGSSDPSDLVAAVWPDSNSTALTAQISGTVPVTVSNTVATNSNITGGSVGVTGTVATNSNITGGSVGVTGTVATNTNITGGSVGVTGLVATTAPGTTINGAGFTGASTSLTVASTTGFSTSGFIGIPGSGGTLIFAYTGTTSVSFTGVSLVSGTAGWTIANGAAVTQTTASPSSVGVTGTVATNTNITGGSVGVTGSVATTAGSTLTTATGSGSSTSLTVASTSTFPSQGLLSVVSNNGSLIFSYTGTTSTTFTGLVLLTGSASSTIASSAPVVTATSSNLSGTITTNPLAPAADLVHQGTYTTTWTVSAAPTITLVNETETNTYVGFMVVFTSMFYTTHIGQGGRFVFTNTVTGQVQKTYVPTIRTDYGIGLQTYFPIPVDGGNAYNITFVPDASPSGGSVNIAWNIIAYRQPPVNTVIGSTLNSLNTVPYGGLLNSQLTLTTATSGVFPGTVTDGTSQVTRIQMVAAVMTSAAAAITGYVSFCDGSTAYPVAAIDMTQGTSTTHAASMLLNGVLLTNGGGLLVNNQTNKTLLVTTYFDVLSYPNIS